MFHLILDLPILTQLGVVVILLPVAVKVYIVWNTGVCTSKNKLIGKTVIITGANAGIGKETALDLAGRGARIIMACRDLKKAEIVRGGIVKQTGNENVIVKRLDLGSFKSVRQFAADILKSESRLDILINNAGCAFGFGKSYTEDGNEYQMQSNHFGHFLLTNLLLGLMIQTDQVRIINVSSIAHTFYPNFDMDDLKFERTANPKLIEIYCISKLCNILFTNELVKKLEPLGKQIVCNSVHPGTAHTKLGKFIIIPLVTEILDYISRFFNKTAKEGAQTQIHLAVSDEVAGITGKYFDNCRIGKPSEQSQDAGLAKKLWEISETVVNLKPEERHYN